MQQWGRSWCPPALVAASSRVALQQRPYPQHLGMLDFERTGKLFLQEKIILTVWKIWKFGSHLCPNTIALLHNIHHQLHLKVLQLSRQLLW